MNLHDVAPTHRVAQLSLETLGIFKTAVRRAALLGSTGED